jgi:hypothetical protein
MEEGGALPQSTSSKKREVEKNIKFAPQWIRSILLDLIKDDV